MCVATLWLTAADSVQDLHLIPFSLQPKLQHQWILLQSYNKWAEKQQACSIVFPECSHNLSKVTTNEAETEKKKPIFFPGYMALSFKKKKMTKAPLPDSVRIGIPLSLRMQRNLKWKSRALCIKNFAKIICNTEIFYVNLYKEYTSLKSRELEELLRFQVMSWQPS